MDDARIRELTEEVLAQIRGSSAAAGGDLESRVAALEAAVRDLQRGHAPATAGTAIVVAHTHAHPSLQLLDVPGGSTRCLLEPDKPCVQSGQCRTLGH